MRILNSAAGLAGVALLAACSTSTKYKQVGAPQAPKPADYHIFVYAPDVKVPRAYEVIGTLHVGDTGFTVVGGSLEAVTSKVIAEARKKGADAVKVKSVQSPGYAVRTFQMDAEFVRFTDAWEKMPETESELLGYLRQNEAKLDPLEGLWSVAPDYTMKFAVRRDTSKPGRIFAGFLLEGFVAPWEKGHLKIEFKQVEESRDFGVSLYARDFISERATVTATNAAVLRIPVRRPSQTTWVTCVKTALPGATAK